MFWAGDRAPPARARVEYVGEDGRRVGDPEVIERIAKLAIPPAWRDVWICPDAMAHLQATGVNGAGRKQYRYHDRWRARRDQQKFDSISTSPSRSRQCAAASSATWPATS